jgi:hypothetical protein
MSLKVFCGPQRRLTPVGSIYFFVDIVDMGFDGMYTDGKLISNSLAGVSGGDIGKHLFFSVCQTGKFGI